MRFSGIPARANGHRSEGAVKWFAVKIMQGSYIVSLQTDVTTRGGAELKLDLGGEIVIDVIGAGIVDILLSGDGELKPSKRALVD